MKGVLLSPRAEHSLDQIAVFSLETFGKRRGDRYIADLLGRCLRVAQGKVPHRSCRAHFADDLREDLRFVTAGRHHIIFVATVQGIGIVDFIHQSADVTGRLTGDGDADAM